MRVNQYLLTSVINITLSGLCGLVVGIALALLWHLVTMFILISPYDGFLGDVYAVIIDCSVGAALGTLGGICISLYCPRGRRLSLLLGLTSIVFLVPAIVWDISDIPHRIVINGSVLSSDAFTSQIWYVLLWGLPAIGFVTGLLCRRTVLGKLGVVTAVVLVAYGFSPPW